MLHFIFLPIAESLAALGLLTQREVTVFVESRECFRKFRQDYLAPGTFRSSPDYRRVSSSAAKAAESWS
jgi:hypothetical protein